MLIRINATSLRSLYLKDSKMGLLKNNGRQFLIFSVLLHVLVAGGVSLETPQQKVTILISNLYFVNY